MAEYIDDKAYVMKFTHLLYVRKFSMFTHKNELFVYAVNTNDVFHTIGEIITSTLEHIERIDYVELTQENVAPCIKKRKHTNIPIYACSVCREEFCDLLYHRPLYRYCPNCGARMDGKEA